MSRDDKLRENIAKGLDEVGVILRRQKRLQRGIVSEFIDNGKLATSATERDAMYSEISAEYKEFGKSIDEWIGKNITRTAKSFWGYARDDIDGSVIKWGEFSEDDLPNIIESVSPSAVEGSEDSESRSAIMLAVLLWLMRTSASSSINEGVIAEIAGGSLAGGGLSGIASNIFAEYEKTGIAPGGIRKATKAEIAKRMSENLTKIAGQLFYVDADGKKWTAENYFKMLNRSMHAEAARTAYADTAQKSGMDLFVIAGGVTGSSAKYPNDPCDDWAGRIFSMSGRNKNYPSYADVKEAGVYHPNCVHYMRIATAKEVAA